MGYVGGYDLHLYCDGPEHYEDYQVGGVVELTGESHAECVRVAKSLGWVIIEYRQLSPAAKSVLPKQGVCRAFCKECTKKPGFAALKKKLTDKKADR
jgi:predicted nucleic acid-binding OB-fold protein